MVERYDLEFYLIGATQPFQVTDLGKPAPEADGKIREDFTTRLSSWPLPGVLYEARVAAVGSTGAGPQRCLQPVLVFSSVQLHACADERLGGRGG